MHQFKWIIFALFCLGTSPSDAYEGIEKVYANMLVTKSSVQVKAAASYLYNSPTVSTEILDLTAAVLYQQQQNSEVTDDTLAWLAKLLGDSKNYRYSELLLSCSKNSKFPSLKKYAKKAYNGLKKSDVDLFSPKQFDLSTVVSNLNKEASSANAEGFKNLVVGDLGTSIIDKAGLPDRIVIDYVSKHQPFVGRISHPHIALVYTNLGKIRLDHPGDKGTPVVIGKIQAIYTFQQNDYLAGFAKAEPTHIREMAKRMYTSYIEEPDVIKRSIQYINDNMSKEDKIIVDAMAWLCKVVARTDNADYYPQLMNIAENAESRKLRKYAKKSASLLPH